MDDELKKYLNDMEQRLKAYVDERCVRGDAAVAMDPRNPIDWRDQRRRTHELVMYALSLEGPLPE